MNSSQMLITLGAMMLLSLVILRVNNNFMNTSDVLISSKYNVIAISIASSIIEEASSKSFDHQSDTTAVLNTAGLTGWNALGPEDITETRYFFNDFDDFNNFNILDTIVVDSILVGVFNVVCTVNYVESTAPDSAVAYETWNKNLSVQVTSNTMTDTVRMSTIYSYWYFR